jgi:hypothetical protein
MDVVKSTWQLYAEIEELRAVVARAQALERALKPPPPPAAQHSGTAPGAIVKAQAGAPLADVQVGPLSRQSVGVFSGELGCRRWTCVEG